MGFINGLLAVVAIVGILLSESINAAAAPDPVPEPAGGSFTLNGHNYGTINVSWVLFYRTWEFAAHSITSIYSLLARANRFGA